MSVSLVIPEQIARCACAPDDWRPCNGELYRCAGCGFASEDPMPYAEAMESPGLDLSKESSWFFYCQLCAFAWILDGADVRAVAPFTERAA
jgi:hypothetical protein